MRWELEPRGKPALGELVADLQLSDKQDFLDLSCEVRRDNGVPQQQGGRMRSAFQVYIDNFDEYEVVLRSERDQ